MKVNREAITVDKTLNENSSNVFGLNKSDMRDLRRQLLTQVLTEEDYNAAMHAEKVANVLWARRYKENLWGGQSDEEKMISARKESAAIFKRYDLPGSRNGQIPALLKKIEQLKE